MAKDAKPSRLGRGLAALMGEVETAPPKPNEPPRSARRAPIEMVNPNPRNPRRAFSAAELDELAASISERGVIQPIVVRTAPGAPKEFEIIAGERRWRAAQRAGLHEMPIVVIEATDQESLELAIIENVQRSDLNPIEEATGYVGLMNDFNYSQDDVAKVVGKSRPHVANMLRLLKLSENVKAYVRSGQLSAGHARMLVGQPNAEELAADIIERGLSVRQVEEMARESGREQAKEVRREYTSRGAIRRDPNTVALEMRVSNALGLRVTIDHRGEGGALHVHYRTLEQLDEVVRKLERK
jgi:ParB family chromosome partitioning protein